MKIINIINFDLIINISISIFIGLTISNLLSDLISKYIQNFFGFVSAWVGKKLFPLEFRLFFIKEDNNVNQQTFNRVINIKKVGQIGTTAFDLPFTVCSEAKQAWPYKNSHVQIFLVDELGKLKIHSHEKLPGQPLRYKIGEFELLPNKMQHFRASFKPQEWLKNYKIKFWIYFNGRKIESEDHFIEVNFI